MKSSVPARPTEVGVRAWVFDLALAAGFLVLLWFLGRNNGNPPTTVTALLAAAIALRRLTWPVMSVLATTAAGWQLAHNIVEIANIGYFPLFWALGGHQDRRVRRFGLAAALIAILVGTGWGLSREMSARGLLLFGAATAFMTLGGWMGGFLRWQRMESIALALDAGLAAAEQRRLGDLLQQRSERTRIAADMHDVVAHSWAVVAAQADGARYSLRHDPDQAEASLQVIGDTARSAMADVRRLLARLREQESDGQPLEFERREHLLSRMAASGMDLRIRTDGDPAAGMLGLTAHRLLGEALTNALKHGDLARPVFVSEDWSNGYRLRVSNTIPEGQVLGSGHGLVGMSERAALAGGECRADRDGTQWVVDAVLGAGAEPDREQP